MSSISQYKPASQNAMALQTDNFKFFTEGLHLSSKALTHAGVLLGTIEAGASDFRSQTIRGYSSWQYRADEDGKGRWFLYDKIPKFQRQKIDDFYGDVYAHYLKTALVEAAKNQTQQVDIAYFLGLKVRKDGTGYNTKEASDLAKACGFLRLLDILIEQKIWKNGLHVSKDCKIDNKTPFMAWVAGVIKPLNLYGFKIGNGLMLTAKVEKEWKERGRECLVSQYFNNDNAGTLEQRHIDFMIVHYAKNKMSMPQLVDLLKRVFDIRVTRQAVEFHLSKPENRQKYIVAREGYLVAAKATKSYFKIAEVPFCDALWLIDASPFALFADDGHGVRKSTRTAVYVRDAKSRKCVGVAFGETETGELVRQALRNAIGQTGYLPHALRYDCGSGNTNAETKAVFDMLSKYHFPNAPYAPTGKFTVEQLVNEVEKVLQGFDNFAGGNITRRGTEKSINPDTVALMKREGRMPTTDQTGLQMWTAIEVVNNTRSDKDGKTPTERYAQDKDPLRRPATTPLVAAAFWDLRPREIRYENGGLIMQVGKDRFGYHVGTPMIEDYQFKCRNEGKKFFIRENPQDRKVIALYDSQDRFVAEAVLKHEFSLLPEFRAEGEGRAWQIGQDNKQRYLNDGKAAYEAAKERLEAQGLPTEFDFMTRNKEQLGHLEGDAIERLLEVQTHITKSAKSKKATPSVSETKTVNNAPNFMLEYGE